MDRPTLDNSQAVFQAGDTVHVYLHRAVKIIDDCFGEGYAAANPTLVAECVRSQTLDYNTTAMTAALYSLRDTAEELGGHVTAILDDIVPKPES